MKKNINRQGNSTGSRSELRAGRIVLLQILKMVLLSCISHLVRFLKIILAVCKVSYKYATKTTHQTVL